MKYFVRAIVLVSSVGFMLTHTLWRKVCPEECEAANEALNITVFDALKDQRWNTAREMSDFALSEPIVKNITDLALRIRIINAAIAAKFSQHSEVAKRHIASIDWSASVRDFKLAIAVLEDRFDDAAEIMKTIGKSGELVGEVAYHDWPLFHRFREAPQFRQAYQEIFGVSFVKEAVRQSAGEAKKQERALESIAREIDVSVIEDVVPDVTSHSAAVDSTESSET